MTQVGAVQLMVTRWCVRGRAASTASRNLSSAVSRSAAAFIDTVIATDSISPQPRVAATEATESPSHPTATSPTASRISACSSLVTGRCTLPLNPHEVLSRHTARLHRVRKIPAQSITNATSWHSFVGASGSVSLSRHDESRGRDRNARECFGAADSACNGEAESRSETLWGGVVGDVGVHQRRQSTHAGVVHQRVQQILGDPKVTPGRRNRHARPGRTHEDALKVRDSNEIVFDEGAPHDVGSSGGGSDLAELGQHETEGMGGNAADPGAGQRIHEGILSGPQHVHTAQCSSPSEEVADGRDSAIQRRSTLVRLSA